MPLLVLKIDVDTCEGTRRGVPQLQRLLESRQAPATFLFSVGPDHTGRAIKRVFRPGFLAKVGRTSVAQNYGLKTLMYGVLLPGPHIGRRAAAPMRAVAAAGFEVGLHTHDHVRWQDGVARASAAWTRRELQRGVAAFGEVFGHAPTTHGAAGWQINEHVPALQLEFGFTVASDTRGAVAFVPRVNGVETGVPQFPTDLPTLDELIGRDDLAGGDPVSHLLGLTAAQPANHVYTLHAELEGGRYAELFARLLDGWKSQGYRFATLAQLAAATPLASLPRRALARGTVAGRSGELSVAAAA